MRFLTLLLLTLATASPIPAADEVPPPAPVEALPGDEQRIELGGGVSLPRPVFEQLAAREEGLAMIERMEQRAKEASTFSGVPHLILIFVSALLFFWSALLYYQRKHARLHRTIQLMVEKGLPVPLEILRAAENAESSAEGGANVVTPPIVGVESPLGRTVVGDHRCHRHVVPVAATQ